MTGAIDRQVARNVQVPVSIQTEDLVEIRPGEALQNETCSRMRYELTGNAAVIAVEESDHASGKTRGRGGVSKYCRSVRAIGLTKDAEGRAASRECTTDHASAKPAGSCCACYSISVAGSGVIDAQNTVVKISRIGIIYSNHAVAIWADTLSQHTIRDAGSSILKSGHTNAARADAVAPNAVCGAPGSGKSLATNSDPIDGLPIHACCLTIRRSGVSEHPSPNGLAACPKTPFAEPEAVSPIPSTPLPPLLDVSIDSVYEAGSRRCLSVNPIGEPGSGDSVTQHPREVLAFTIQTDARRGVGGDFSHTRTCSCSLAIHAVLEAGSGSGSSDTNHAASTSATARLRYQTLPTAVLLNEHDLVTGSATERAGRKLRPWRKHLRAHCAARADLSLLWRACHH